MFWLKHAFSGSNMATMCRAQAAVLALQDIVGLAPSQVSLIGTFISDGVGGFLPTSFENANVEDARTLAASPAGGVCVGGNKAVGCFDIAADGTPTLISAASTGFTSLNEAITVDASGSWLLLPIVTQNSIQVYRIDPVSGALSFASSASVVGTPAGILLSADNQHLVVVLSDINIVSVRQFDPVTGTLPSSPQPTVYPVGSNPSRVVVGAFTGSSPFGYAVTNKDSNTLSLLPGDATGPTGPQTSYSLACSPTSIAVSDLDGDNDSDIVISCSASPPLTVLLNSNGQGGFVPSQP